MLRLVLLLHHAGAVLRLDKKQNAQLYGEEATPETILNIQRTKRPPAFDRLVKVRHFGIRKHCCQLYLAPFLAILIVQRTEVCTFWHLPPSLAWTRCARFPQSRLPFGTDLNRNIILKCPAHKAASSL